LPALKAVAEPLSTAITELARLVAELRIAIAEERKQQLTARIDEWLDHSVRPTHHRPR
jgi:hypothetical protein